jgi:hypothetical protein
MDNIKSQRRSLREQLLALEANVEEPEDLSDYDPAILMAKESILAQLAQLHLDEATLKAQIRQKQVNTLQIALTANDQLPASTPYEINRRLFNRLGIQLFLNGTLSESEESQLYALTAAGQTEGGLAVEDAKFLLPLCSSNSISPREQNEEKPDPSGTKPSEGLMILTPNPVVDIFEISLNTDENGAVTVTDLTGRVMLSLFKSAGQQVIHINTAEMPDGVYIVSCQTASGSIFNKTLVVQH